ncbi:Cadherin EGF LAG seven-pass G-type receptor 3, partial [Armadillidium vulgare]
MSNLNVQILIALLLSNVETYRASQFVGCKTGEVFTPSGCKKINLCLFNPCLHGGKCNRMEEGVSCQCPERYVGHYCQWDTQAGGPPESSVLLILVSFISSLF